MSLTREQILAEAQARSKDPEYISVISGKAQLPSQKPDSNYYKEMRAKMMKAPEQPIIKTTPPPDQEKKPLTGYKANIGKTLGFFEKVGGAMQKVGEGAVKALTGSEQALGKTFGGAIATKSKDVQDAMESKSKLDDMTLKLAKQIGENKKVGKDTSRLENQLKINLEGSGMTMEDLIPELRKSTKQIAGETIGVLTDVLSAGVLPGKGKAVSTIAKGAEEATKATSTFVKGAKAGAKAGLTYGTASGVAKGMQEDKSLGGVIVEGVKGGLIGGATGGLVGGVAGKISGSEAAKKQKIESQAVEDLSPKMNKANRKDMLKSSKWVTDPKTGEKVLQSKVKTTGSGITEETKYVADDNNEVIKRFKDVVARGKNPEEKIANIREVSENAGKKIDDIMDKHPMKMRNTDQIINDIEKESVDVKRKLALGKDSARNSAWNTAVETLKQSLDNQPKTRAGIKNAFREFNSIASDMKAYEGTENVLKTAIKTMRDGLRKEMLKGLPEDVAKNADDLLLTQSHSFTAMKNIIDNYESRVGDVSKLIKLFQDYKKEIAIGGAALVGGTIGSRFISPLLKE